MSQQVYAFLEQLQRATYAKLKLQAQVYDDDWVKKIETIDSDEVFNKVFGDLPERERKIKFQGWKSVASQLPKNMASLREAVAKKPTEFEHPGYYAILCRLQEETERAAKALAESRKFNSSFEKVYLGTLPTGEVNARVMPVPRTKDHLIIFDSQLFNFANLMSKPIASAMPVRDTGKNRAASGRPSDILQTLAERPEIAERFIELLQVYLITGTPAPAAPYSVEGDQAYMAGLLLDSFELFAMGHEYGHIISGHLTRKATSMFALPNGTRVEEVKRSWEEEFVADARGVEISSAALQIRGIPFQMSFIGPTFFFMCAFYIERGLSILRTGKDLDPNNLLAERSLTHPPAGLRLASVYSQLKSGLPSQYYQAVEAGRDIIFGVADVLWQIAAPKLRQLHDNGVKPSKVWLDLARTHQGGTY